MNFDWQTVVALVLVAAAVAYLARLGWQTLAAKRGCGSCGGGGCGSTSAEASPLGKEKPLVTLEAPGPQESETVAKATLDTRE
ncbi:MAG: hypothetical protein DWQ31_00455 [Planctomycetota bacterium]|nr:MAG: hypothetical protein DWQ31_00455 [Planctomycetota bacterium]REJ86661.1 MAG: hypothetical protein DWQ35_22795 [Planctomycetota bacterium]REK27166.1 MAG: hypothetical protein DWQ42_07620 [Planctomycetota bacterium]REK37837.1 MAG: hypothetical protein DWQ46_21485 [Planctomycetota bacterium]